LEETEVIDAHSSPCPHCGRTILAEPRIARSGSIFECPWPSCGQQVGFRGDELLTTREILSRVLSHLPDHD